mgnify:CR=1 FL=1
MKLKKPYSKPKPDYDRKPKPKSPSRPKWQVEREEEHETCPAIRRNLRDFTQTMRNLEARIAREQQAISVRNRAIERHRHVIEQLSQLRVTGGIFSNRAEVDDAETRRWIETIRAIMRFVGRTATVVEVANRIHIEQTIFENRRRLEDLIRIQENTNTLAEQQIRKYERELRKTEQKVQDEADDFEERGCLGKVSDNVVYGARL